MAKSKILKEIANNEVTLEVSLKRALLIANDLKNEKLTEWIKHELFGYPNAKYLPEYRKIPGNLKLSYVSGYTRISNQPIGIAILPENLQDIAVFRCCDGINMIEEASKQKQQSIVSLADAIPFLKKQSYLIQVLDFYMEIPGSGFNHIIDSVSCQLLEILMKIDNEIGNIDELDICASEKQIEIVNNYINIKIDSFTSIGDGNQIKDAQIAGKEITKNGK